MYVLKYLKARNIEISKGLQIYMNVHFHPNSGIADIQLTSASSVTNPNGVE